jgi:cytochrome c oxidase subunit 3
MAHAAVQHAEHEFSYWPLPTGLGAMCIPFSFIAYFAWEQPLLGLILAGMVAAFLVVGLSGWAHEFFTSGHEEKLAQVAVVLFIISEVIIFGTMFAAFWTGRVAFSVQWAGWIPPGINLGLAGLLTLILWASSLTILLAEKAIEHDKRSASLSWLIATMALGTLFVVLHVNEWRHLWGAGFTLSANYYGTTFFALTGVHTSHVLVGIIAQIFLFGLLVSGKLTSKKMTIFRATSLYWHFVDLMWMLVASNAYVIGGMR